MWTSSILALYASSGLQPHTLPADYLADDDDDDDDDDDCDIPVITL